MTKGIFNPFKKPGTPKQDFVSPTDAKNPLNTEYQEPPKSTIRLDGDSYVLQLNDLELEEVNERLELILKTVAKQYARELQSAGVSFIVKPQKPDLTSGQLKLETPTGYVIVYAGDQGKEVDCFRRLAYALYTLPIKELLAKHKARVYKRG
jgi:hypothetical protein